MSKTVLYDLVVVGGGPAGLTATMYAIRKKLNVLMVSKDLGGKTSYRLALPWIKDYQVIRGLDVVNNFIVANITFTIKNFFFKFIIFFINITLFNT